MRRLVVLLPLVVLLACTAATGRSSTAPSLQELVGQRLVVAMRGTSPSAGLLARVRAGEVGGVILFGGNVINAPQVRALTAGLQAAARAGGRSPLLIAVDQEGGRTRRFRWASPAASAPELGLRPASAVQRSGLQTGRALRALGVNLDLAPVADVPSVPHAFIERQERAFSRDPAIAGNLASAFARGLRDGGVAATAKHFPGLGRATTSTDVAAVTIAATRAQLAADLAPYRPLIDGGVPLVMISNATYPSLDTKPAAWSPAVQSLLRSTLGFGGVTITDALDAAAADYHRPLPSVAVLAAQSGIDLILVAGSEAVSEAVFQRLADAAAAGTLSHDNLERSYARILALKRTLG